MQELRFIGADDGALIVSGDGGEQYRLIVDDALRDALRPRPHTRSEAPKVAPREIQQLIRAGRTAEQVVELTGADLDDVLRFEGPVMAEREHIVEQARLVAVRVHADLDPLDAEPATFGSALDDRLESLGASRVRWDAWKDPEYGWRVGLEFEVEQIARDAMWSFEPRSHALAPLNPSAVALSQQGELASLQGPRLRVVENERPSADTEPSPSIGGLPEHEESRAAAAPAAAPASPSARDAKGADWLGSAVTDIGSRRREAEPQRDETADLLEQLRRRRGERQPQSFDEFDDDLALDDDASETDRDHEAAPARDHDAADASGASEAPDEPAAPARGVTRLRPAVAVDVPLAGLEAPESSANPAEAGPAPEPVGASVPHASNASNASTGSSGGRGSTGPLGKRRGGRASLPSWDEIVFGTRSDD